MRPSHLLPVALLMLAACGGGGGDDEQQSGNANLASLIVENAPLTPAFGAATTSYAATVIWATRTTRVTAVTASNDARLAIDGVTVASGAASGPIDLIVGNTTISVVVTAENGTMRTYSVVVTRPPAGTDASLADLALTAGPLDQLFDPAAFDYTATLGHLAASTRVVATPTDPLVDGITVDGQAATVGQPSTPRPLAVGETTLIVAVTAEDETTTASYQVTATRADLASLGQTAYVKATNTNAGDRFGSAVALAGDRLLIGAPFEQSVAAGVDGNQADNSQNGAGAAYLYERLSGTWAPGHYLKAGNTNPDDRFGAAVTATDSLLAVGAPGEQSLNGSPADNSGNDVGAVYVFEPDAAGTPVATGYLKASKPDDLDRFGAAVAAWDRRILVGAPFEASNATGVGGDGSDNSLNAAGAAYLFEPVDADFVEVAYIKASNTASGTDNQFGSALAISGDRLAVGAWREDSGATGINGNQTDTSRPNAGAVYVFERGAAGAWAQTAYVKASNTDTDHNFGAAVALDGHLLAVGAPGENTAAQGSGAVYVFARSDQGSWSQEAFLKPQVVGVNDFFGADLSLVGNLLAVGATGDRADATGINDADDNENAVSSGAVYLFERQANGSWLQIAYVKAFNTDAGDLFGSAMALAGDTLAVGAIGEQSNATGVGGDPLPDASIEAGAVYLFQ